MTDTVIAFVDGSKVNLMRRKGKGADVVGSFALPSTDPDDMARRVFAVVDALAPPEPEPTRASAPPPPAAAAGKRRGRKPGGTLLSAKDVVDFVAAAGAVNVDSAIPEAAILDHFADRGDRSVLRARLQSIATPSQGNLAHDRVDGDGGPVKVFWLHDAALAKIEQAAIDEAAERLGDPYRGDPPATTTFAPGPIDRASALV
jgi:hypothetical protein